MDTDWFKTQKKALKLTDAKIAEAIGLDRSIANRIINGTLAFDTRHTDAFASVFQVDRNEILKRAGVLREADDIPAGNALPVPMEGASSQKMRENLPVYGTALGASRRVNGDAIEQTTLNKSDIVHYAKRPVMLNNRADAYGLYVQGSSMAPAHEDGSLIAVAPNMPLRVGDYVVVYLRPIDPDDDDGVTARAVLLKRLVKRNASVMELEQFNPPKIFSINADEVVRTDRVLTVTEMLS